MTKITKRDGTEQEFNFSKIEKAITSAFNATRPDQDNLYEINRVLRLVKTRLNGWSGLSVEIIQDLVEECLMITENYDVAKSYILYREKHNRVRDWVIEKEEFINNYKKSFNTADATIDDNSNVKSKNIGILNAEIHKPDNIQISRKMVMDKLKELYPDFDAKQYIRDLEHHIIYKHDESSFAGAIAPYCCSISMYPFLTDGIKNLGGLSAAPKNLDSFCGMYINLIFATSAMFAGAVATSEFLLYFDYFARKEWGDNYYQNPDLKVSTNTTRIKTIRNQIHQYWQQVIYSINQPAAARGMQSASKLDCISQK